jgi:hypothetical protein
MTGGVDVGIGGKGVFDGGISVCVYVGWDIVIVWVGVGSGGVGNSPQARVIPTKIKILIDSKIEFLLMRYSPIEDPKDPQVMIWLSQI